MIILTIVFTWGIHLRKNKTGSPLRLCKHPPRRARERKSRKGTQLYLADLTNDKEFSQQETVKMEEENSQVPLIFDNG